jgi:hypothetical protein
MNKYGTGIVDGVERRCSHTMATRTEQIYQIYFPAGDNICAKKYVI